MYTVNKLFPWVEIIFFSELCLNGLTMKQKILTIVSSFNKSKINSYPQIDICFLRVLDLAK